MKNQNEKKKKNLKGEELEEEKNCLVKTLFFLIFFIAMKFCIMVFESYFLFISLKLKNQLMSIFFLLFWKIENKNIDGLVFVGDIGMMVRVFVNGPRDLGSIPRWVIPKTQKMEIEASLLNTQHYKVGIKDKVEQSRERSSALPYTTV